jgi:hypothetical protein
MRAVLIKNFSNASTPFKKGDVVDAEPCKWLDNCFNIVRKDGAALSSVPASMLQFLV